MIRRQVLAAFRGAGDDWHVLTTIADDLEPLVDIGDDYGRLGDWISAATVYQTVAQTSLDEYTQLHDEEGSLHAVVDRCVEEQQWRTLIAGLREEHKRLRALREELERAGL